jgi:2-polyprenyl-3-methyl-5-hydroxy-6-metoxy-1,4-benzoquinol methylase
MSYMGLNIGFNSEEKHLGGNIIEGDPFTFAPNVWDYLIDRFALKSVLDLGSGVGHAANYFFNKNIQVVAVDGLKDNCEKAVYPTIQIDLTKTKITCKVDLVHCQEVVEHIEDTYIDNLMQSLSCGNLILMTHALPGQGGHHHVNEQLPEYWIEQLKNYGYKIMQEDTRRIRLLAKQDEAHYLSNTALLATKENK